MPRLRVGLFGIGLEAYWPQFAGLRERLTGYIGQVASQLARPDVEVVNLGLVDTPEKALAAGHQCRRDDVDIIFLYVTTYALSATVLPAVRRARVPVIILSLSPSPAIDYASFNQMGDRTRMTGEWLAYCQPCSMPEIANVFRRCQIPFFQVTGTLADDPQAWQEVHDWIDAARVAHIMEHNRLGLMGHYYGGMLDIYSDLTLQCAVFGGHIELIEVEELAALRANVLPNDIAERIQKIRDAMDVQSDCSDEELARAAKTSVALDRLVDQHRLGSLAYYYQGTWNPENEDAISSIILGNSLLTARGIPVAGEYEVKNVQAMKILDSFGAGGSFTEYYAVDFHDDVVLMGHDGPGHIAIAQGKTKVRPLSRQGRTRAIGRNVGEAWPCYFAFRRRTRRETSAADRRSRVGRRANSRDRQYQQPLPVFHWRAKLYCAVEFAWTRTSLRRGHRTHFAQAGKTGRAAQNRVCSSVLMPATQFFIAKQDCLVDGPICAVRGFAPGTGFGRPRIRCGAVLWLVTLFQEKL